MYGQKLIAWYEINKRSLPWRDTLNPYLIWVSEIILQQTRVNQGLSYYYRFTDTYPDILSLAGANIDEVLKLWQGLGYYSRARNMHAAAKDIVIRYHGEFPTTYDELVTIKGIGDYTASAIASFAFSQAVPVIDGNVNRVIARLFGIQEPINKPSGQKNIRSHAWEMLVHESPGIYNQAIMEFGALQCVPHRPDCTTCILSAFCVAFNQEIVAALPIKERTLKMKTRYFHYIVINYKKHTFIRRRSDGDIWNGLYEFPVIETATKTEPDELYTSGLWQKYFEGTNPQPGMISPEYTHRLTHQILKVRFYEVYTDKPLTSGELIEVAWESIHQYAIPKVIDNYLEIRK